MSSAADVKAPLEFCKGINGLEKVILRGVRGCSAEVLLYGGQITSWKNEHGEELLFVSSMAMLKPPKPIRGGIPICFPQFSNNGSLEQHGFARNRFWNLDSSPPPFPTNSSNKTFVDLILKPTDEDMKIWPHSFEFRLRVTLGPAGDLMLTSRIRNTNTDGKPFTFTFAYHISLSRISVKYVLKDWRHWIILTICRTSSDLLNKGMQSLSNLKWTRYISGHLRRLQFWTMKRSEHLSFVKMVFLTPLSGILGIRRQRHWLILEMMNTSTCCVLRQLQWKNVSL
ncbi:hypothetical protein Pfo_029549 [Paulownia fortunei]|nr:hypothetical protein Pfo_029549 [Paulownia fortunei]